MRLSSSFAIVLCCLMFATLLPAQRRQRDTLTPAQVEKIRESGIDPPGRVKLYTQFVDEHVETITALARRVHSRARAQLMDNELQDLAALMDEFGDNLDVFSDRKADVRRALKPLNDATKRWLDTLHAIPSEPGFDLSLKDAIASGQDLAEQASTMLTEQTAYFKTHKDQRGQDREEPQ
jgi:hypothetical protein